MALFGWAPFALLFGVLDLDAAQVGEMNALAAFAAEHRAAVVGAWTAFMTAWAVSLAVRAVQAGARKRSFVMLNGVLSGTRVMTEAGVELARERRGVLDVDEDAEEEYTIVGSQEANPMEGCISDDSPFGFALKGHKVGETVTVTAPVGELQFKIIAVENED